tara:strand:+ start:1167 stop:3215 length:2049 start_codon:yes stop_codon:yes gene_type:complete
MIIILEPQKDTYVTNIKTQNNDASLANVGHAATLDLFKLYNENKHSKSWAVFGFNDEANNGGLLVDNDEFKLIDAEGNEVNFIIKTGVDTEDGSKDGATEKVVVGVFSTNGGNNQAARFATVINNVSNFDNGLTLKIKAYNNSNNELVLKQDKSGELGDTIFELPTNMAHIHGLDRFARIDYSNLLIKFDLENFKKEWNISDALGGAFSTLKAELVLKDVTTGIAKPKDYSLELFKLIKEFEEGIGKDTIHFSDSDISNFINLSNTNEWEIQDYISNTDAIALSSPSKNNVNIGNEDLIFDITEYIKNRIVENPPQDKGFLIKFSDDNLYDNKSYFVKRLGSRHLINKQFVPQLRIKINDSEFNIPTNSYNKVRYLNNEEDFYLFNRIGSKLINFVAPNITDTLNFRIKSKDKKNIILQDQSTSSKTNFSGDSLNGVKIATINLSKFDNIVSGLIENNKVEVCYEWYWLDQLTTTVSAGNFVIGKRYKIKTSTDTSFTAIGADNNDIGTVFTATGEGEGSNDAYELIEKKIVENNVVFYTSETSNETKYENLITSIRVTENDLFANDGTSSVEVYFVDTKKEFNAVKVPYELPSENIGDVFYQIYDIETGNILVDYDESEIDPSDTNASATKMFYDGEKYKFNLFIPKLFKNLRVNFKFKYKDPITNVDKFIFNEKYSVRIL